MLNPTDREYKATKLIKQGRASLPDKFVPFAEWISDRFDCSIPINIVTDKTFLGDPRLQIIFEFEADAERFMGEDSIQFDEAKQTIVMEQFRKAVLRRRFFGLDYNRMFAIFGSFESVARIEANSKVGSAELAAIQAELGNPDLWTVRNIFSAVWFLLHTDDQLEAAQCWPIRQQFLEAYSRTLARYDEFGYFKKRSVDLYLSSKETFDRDYESNWYYFFK